MAYGSAPFYQSLGDPFQQKLAAVKAAKVLRDEIFNSVQNENVTKCSQNRRDVLRVCRDVYRSKQILALASA